jgi:hypothetical protein
VIRRRTPPLELLAHPRRIPQTAGIQGAIDVVEGRIVPARFRVTDDGE